ncbi:fibronectin type III domain-containing protein [uncultured Lacinutrix sp.]|uniref:GEVED domain-containing protein n=1 Tax=uncultured Lacinutrix sp. TaxID=574032 RepID=UPI002611C018|nr:fibronectin type III domain-containing protein [uncultured Lacinutrix sp.]
MKKITLLYLLMFSASLTFAQVIISENFDNGTPAGWTDSFSNTGTQSCSGNSERDNIYSGGPTGNMTSPNQVGLSNGTDLNISYDYKVVNWSAGTVATPANFGTAELQYSINNGASWITVNTVDATNHIVANTCATISATVPGASLPTGSDVKVQVAITWNAGDYYFYVDNFNANQVVLNPPNCDSVLTSPLDGSVEVSVSGDLTWSPATAAPSGYNVTVGTSTGTSDVYNVALGNVTTTNVGGLMPNTQYFVNIVPVNGVGPATGCTEYSFTTIDSPGCPVVTATPDVACGNYESSLSWDAIDIASSYTVKIGTTSGGTDIADNVNNFSNNAYTFEGAPNTTYYYTISASNEAGTSIDCSEGSFTTAVDLCYCDPSSTNANTTTLIDNVSTTGANVNLSNLESGLSSNHYANNYDTMGVTSFATGTFDFTIEVEGGTLGLGIWVDWNGDKVHDVSENVFTTTSYSNGPFSGTITVPGGTTNGEYHMRIIADFNDLNPGDDDACSLSSGRGETEDYKLTVVDPPVCGAPTALTATNIMFNAADLGWTDAGIATLYNVEIVDVTAGDVVSGSADYSGVSNPYTATNLVEDNDYEFYVQGDCTADGTSLWVGPFAFTTPLACPAPTSLDADNITAVSADLSWTVGDLESLWNIEVVNITAGETVSGTADFTSVTNPYTVTNLSSANDYAYYVQGDCSPNGESLWVGPYNFTTECAAVVSTFPVTTDFSSNPPTCWTEAGAGEVVDGPTGTTSDWKSGRAYTDGSGNVINSNVINLYDDVDREWLMSPIYNIPVGLSHSLVINIALTDYKFSGTSIASNTDNMGSDDQVQLLQSVDAGVTWTNITTWNASNQPAVTGTEYVEDLSAVSGNIQFALWASDGIVDDSEDYDFHVGGFSILPSAPSNDECANADVLTVGTMVSGDTTYATDSGVAASSCGAAGADQDIWYSFTATAAMATEGASFTTTADYLVVYADCAAATEIACLATGENTPALTSGTTYIVRAYNSGIAKVAGPIEITLQEGSLSTSDFDSKSIFSYYPNPVKNTLTLNAQQAITNVSVFNMLGQQVIRNAPNAVTKTLDMSNLQSGAYFVQVTVGTSVETVRIIKN